MFPGVNRGCPLAASRLDFGQAPCGGVLSTLGSGSQRIRPLGGLLSQTKIISIIIIIIILIIIIITHARHMTCTRNYYCITHECIRRSHRVRREY
jgi:hypothetical protein